MAMQSVNLLPALRELPGTAYDRRKSFRDMMADLVDTDRAMYAAEFTASTSFGLWAIFDDVNVDDNLAQAYAAQYPGLAADHSLHEHWQEMLQRGPDSADGFISGLKGKVAEFDAKGMLEQQGWTNVEIASDSTQAVWDISATGLEGESVFFQVKVGASEAQANATMAAMENAPPDVTFLLSGEIYDRIADTAPDLLDSAVNIDAFLAIDGIQDGLSTLSGNLGIDVPDGIGDIVPYAGAIIAGARLIYGALRTEREFKAADRTTRNKIQVVQALTLMSRMGVTTVLATVGGMGGTAAGSAVPFVGNLIGGIVGSVAGVGMGRYLNRHLQPHMLNLALDITGLTNDDLFYYKNKPRIDQVALNFRQTAGELAAAPI